MKSDMRPDMLVTLAGTDRQFTHWILRFWYTTGQKPGRITRQWLEALQNHPGRCLFLFRRHSCKETSQPFIRGRMRNDQIANSIIASTELHG